MPQVAEENQRSGFWQLLMARLEFLGKSEGVPLPPKLVDPDVGTITIDQPHFLVCIHGVEHLQDHRAHDLRKFGVIERNNGARLEISLRCAFLERLHFFFGWWFQDEQLTK